MDMEAGKTLTNEEVIRELLDLLKKNAMKEQANDVYEIATTWHSYWYFHKFIDDIYERFPEILKLEWKGIER